MNWHASRRARLLLSAERGAIRKDWGGRLPIALAFPNSYRVGMSSLAIHTLYRLWNARDDVVCERVFADLQPVLSMESSAPLDHFPVVAFSATYELDYFNLVAVLRSAGIPLLAEDRAATHPLVIAGGPAVSANPEPMAPLLDALVIGEAEPILDGLTEALQLVAEGREAALASLARLPGVYVPGLGRGERHDGSVTRQWLQDLDQVPTHSVIFSPHAEFANTGLIEIARGCGRGCRFCLAGRAYWPPRERSVESIVAQAYQLLPHTSRLGLVSAAVSDHAHIDQLVLELRRLGAQLSVSSLRVDPISESLVHALAESGTRTLTIAPEAGSERLRKMIGKNVTEDDVLRAVRLADREGMAQLKLYFMVGLPTEDDADLKALVSLATACAQRFRKRVVLNLTPFVPKAHTAFQRLEQVPAAELRARMDYVERSARPRGIEVRSESPAWAEIQGVLARGDRRVAAALVAVDRPSPANWRRAMAQAGLQPMEWLKARPAAAPLPWEFIRFTA